MVFQRVLAKSSETEDKMSGYTPLFGSIVTSSIWNEDNETRLVWITMLALADCQGIVEGSVPGLAHVARVSTEECRKAIQVLSSPDPDSRTADHEGRRIHTVDGGWQILCNECHKRTDNYGGGQDVSNS